MLPRCRTCLGIFTWGQNDCVRFDCCALLESKLGSHQSLWQEAITPYRIMLSRSANLRTRTASRSQSDARCNCISQTILQIKVSARAFSGTRGIFKPCTFILGYRTATRAAVRHSFSLRCTFFTPPSDAAQ